jgi:transglutaminase-like putative cysteine protease
MTEYLKPTYFLDYENEEVRAFAEKHTDRTNTQLQNAVSLYNAVRDTWYYDPYYLDLRPEGSRASTVMKRRSGHCVSKAIVLAASARYIGIPSRLSFYIVCNHIATERIERFLGTNKLVFHGAAELLLEEKWVKATPAFNTALCHKLNVEVLDFTGLEDSVFQQFDRTGNTFMQYLHEYGAFADVPHDYMISEWKKHYGTVITPELLEKHDFVLDLMKLSAEKESAEKKGAEKEGTAKK